MLDITEKQKETISPYISKIDDYIDSDNLGELLVDLDDAIIIYGMDENQEITAKGIELQRIYDQIYNQN